MTNEERSADQASKKPMARVSRHNKMYNSPDEEESEETASETQVAFDVRTACVAALIGRVRGATVPVPPPGTCNIYRSSIIIYRSSHSSDF